MTYLTNPTSPITSNQALSFLKVIDSTDRERISVSKEELHRMLESDELHKASVLVFANKQDVAGCMTATEISQQLSLQVCIAYNIEHLIANTYSLMLFQFYQPMGRDCKIKKCQIY